MLYKLEQNKAKQELVEKSTKMPPLRILQQYKVSRLLEMQVIEVGEHFLEFFVPEHHWVS